MSSNSSKIALAGNDHAPLETARISSLAVESAAPATSTQSLYRKYRPASFGRTELVGQEPIVRTLQNAVASDRISHAYLFCGPRGTGKTTMARILAKAVNCLAPDPEDRPCNNCAACSSINSGSSTDVIEIDAASNRGIDDIRDLRERVRYSPVELRTKFYIIDEAHQITGAAANAFLKTLEEPPPHVKFVLATTDPDELLPTIVSRCQRFDFRRIESTIIVERLRTVADAESIAIDDDALAVIARHATGSLRDALGTLDLVAAWSQQQQRSTNAPVDAGTVRTLLGVSHIELVEKIAQAIAEGNSGPALAALAAAIEQGVDPRHVNRQLVGYLRQLMYERAGGELEVDPTARRIARQFDLAALAQIATKFNETDFRIRHSLFPQLPLEIAIVESALIQLSGATAVRSTPQNQPAAAIRQPPVRIPPVESTPQEQIQPRTLREAVHNERDSVAAHSGIHPQPSNAGVAGITVEQLIDLWPNICANVKVHNRRIEALLVSTDPAGITGNTITLVAEYPFHRDKLNEDEARQLIEAAISNITKRQYQVNTVLRGEGGQLPQTSAPGKTDTEQSPTDNASSDGADQDAADEALLQAARNIFNATEDV